MAIDLRVEDGLPITVEQARVILQSETDNFGLFLDLDRCLEYELYFKIERDKLISTFNNITGGGLKPTQTQKVRDWFEDAFDVPKRLFVNKAGKVAFDKEVKKNLMEADISENAKSFLQLYNDIAAYNYRISYLKQYLQLPISYSVSDMGHRMLVANPNWEILATSRLAANTPSIQNIARDMKDIVCCPKGWILCMFDSGQIEPRITYSHYLKDVIIRDLIILYNDAYYGQLHYCQLPEDVYQRRHLLRVAKPGEKNTGDPNVIYAKPITEEMKAGRQELKVLALAATYGSALAGRDPFLSQRYVDRIVNHPLRKEWEIEVKQQVNRGNETFTSVFGSTIEVEETERYKRGTPQWRPHVVRCGINNPIQTTASDLMVCSVNKAYQILQKAEKSHIAYYKHDEGAFYIHESEKYLIDELAGITAYNVTENGEKWIPIGADCQIGQYMNSKIPTVLS